MISPQMEIMKTSEHNKKMATVSNEKQPTNWFVGCDGPCKSLVNKDWNEVCLQKNNHLGGDYEE